MSKILFVVTFDDIAEEAKQVIPDAFYYVGEYDIDDVKACVNEASGKAYDEIDDEGELLNDVDSTIEMLMENLGIEFERVENFVVKDC